MDKRGKWEKEHWQLSGSPSTLKSSGMKTGFSRMTVTDCSAPRLLQQKKHSCTAWTAVHTHSQIPFVCKIAPCAPLRERVRHARLAQPISFFDLDTQHNNKQLSVRHITCQDQESTVHGLTEDQGMTFLAAEGRWGENETILEELVLTSVPRHRGCGYTVTSWLYMVLFKWGIKIKHQTLTVQLSDHSKD